MFVSEWLQHGHRSGVELMLMCCGQESGEHWRVAGVVMVVGAGNLREREAGAVVLRPTQYEGVILNVANGALR